MGATICFFSGLAMLLGGIASAVIYGATGALMLFPIGLMVILFGLLAAWDKASAMSRRNRAARMATKLEKSYRVSGADYARFVSALNVSGLAPREMKKAMDDLHKRMLEAGRRISGHDYVELEKGLSRIADGQGMPLFSEEEKRRVLADFEALRTRIRDVTLSGKQAAHPVNKINLGQDASRLAEAYDDISPKSRGIALFLVLTLGCYGAHRFYLGKVGTGLLMLLTGGGLGVWILIDLFMVLFGAMRDKQGRLVKEWSDENMPYL